VVYYPNCVRFQKPVFVINIGSFPEIVDDSITGFIISPNDIYACAIVKLLKYAKLRTEMSENSYIKMKEGLLWNKLAERTTEIYREIFNKHI
jgi:glycosyltransferase involved in cell wall biosynthesis